MEKNTNGSSSDDATRIEAGRSPTPNDSPSDNYALPKWRLICLSLCLCFGLFLSLLDTTIVATALYTIGVDLKSLEKINWIALAYTLSYLGCAVIFARIADIVGRRNAYIAAFLIFFTFSIGCGFAHTLNQLIVFRVLQGIGGSGLYSLTFVILPEISPVKLHQAIGALAGAVVATAGVLGPILGGIITKYTTWRWIFWINAPMGIGPLILFIIAWPKPHHIRHAQLRPIKELDVFGAFLVIAASVLVVFAFQEAGLKPNSWNTALFIAPLVIGILCWVALLGWEVIVAKFWEGTIATMFPLRLIRRRVYMGHFLSTLLAGFPYFVVIYSLPLRMQVVNGKSPLVAGVSLLPMLGAVAVASTVAGAVNSRRDLIFPTLFVGSLFIVIGTATLSTLKNVVAVESRMYGFEVFIGLGFGLMVSTASLGAILECELRDRTVSQGIIAQARILGGSIGIAAITAILGIIEASSLLGPGIITSGQLATLATSAKSMTPVQLHAVRQAYSDSFSEIMKVSAAISGACVFATMLTWRKVPMVIAERRKEQYIEHVQRIKREKALKNTAAGAKIETSPTTTTDETKPSP